MNLNFIKYHDGIIVGFYFLSIERNILFLALFQMRRLVRQNLRKETRNVYDFTNYQHPDLHLSDVCTGKARKILTAAPPKNSVNP